MPPASSAPSLAIRGLAGAPVLRRCRRCPGPNLRRRLSALAGPPPPPPAASALVALSSRRLVYVFGPDAGVFLQGLVTANMMAPDGRPRHEPAFAAFLTAKGRVRHDGFIYPLARGLGGGGGGGFLVEMDADFDRFMLKHLQRHNLHARVGLRDVAPDEASVWQAWDHSRRPPSRLLLPPAADRVVVRDPRAPSLGWRILQLGSKAPALALERRPESDYTIRRYLAGVPEGMYEFVGDQSLPMEYNLDLMNGIDFRKGCYIGQELTIRTKHRGSVRKRVLPCVIYGDDQPAPTALVYQPPSEPTRMTGDMIPGQTPISHLDRGQSAGKWLRGVGNIGLALCRLGIMTDLPVFGEAPARPSGDCVLRWSYMHTTPTLKIKAFPPQWLTRAMQKDEELDEGDDLEEEEEEETQPQP